MLRRGYSPVEVKTLYQEVMLSVLFSPPPPSPLLWYHHLYLQQSGRDIGQHKTLSISLYFLLLLHVDFGMESRMFENMSTVARFTTLF